MKTERWCVVYRIGTREAFEWLRSEPLNKEAAIETARDLDAAMVVNYDQSTSIGLPEGWSYESAR